MVNPYELTALEATSLTTMDVHAYAAAGPAPTKLGQEITPWDHDKNANAIKDAKLTQGLGCWRIAFN